MSWLRNALLTLIGLNMALLALNVALYPAFFTQPNALPYLLEPLALLFVYALIMFLTTRRISPQAEVAARVGLLFGLLTGCLWLVNLTLETFTNLRACYELAVADLLSRGCERKHGGFGPILIISPTFRHDSTAFVTGS